MVATAMVLEVPSAQTSFIGKGAKETALNIGGESVSDASHGSELEGGKGNRREKRNSIGSSARATNRINTRIENRTQKRVRNSVDRIPFAAQIQ